MIENANFILKEIPRFIPESMAYINWWKAEKRKCIEGYWCGGKWMPGPLYFYINYWHISIKENEHSKNEYLGKPFLRDLEWEKAYIYMEAKGFSHFELDIEFTCNRMYRPDVVETNLGLGLIKPTSRIYIPAREYLRKIHKSNLGKPKYENDALNVVDIEARGGGKSYFFSGAIAGHNFLFDGALDYDDYLEKRKRGTPQKSETLVGAIQSMYTTPLCSKIMLGLNELPGKQTYNRQAYNSPLYVDFKGSLSSGKMYIDAVREVKVGNNWVEKGSHSKIHSRSFLDDPSAGNGQRNNVIGLEEIGFFGILEATLGSIRDNTMNGNNKFGVIWMMGTGGDMEGGSTQAVKDVFYLPVENECLWFEDEWENKGKIGYFVPYHRTINSAKDSEGNSEVEKAKKIVEIERELVKKNPKKYHKLLENRPEKPSEAFMTSDSNMFPIKDLQEVLSRIETVPSILNSVWTGDILMNERGKPEYKLTDSIPCYDYPIKNNKNHKGAIVIYEQPYQDIPEAGFYLAGMDPYNDDTSETDSIGSIYIMNRLTERIVASYNGRRDTANDFYEVCRKLIMFYNATCNYENNLKGFFSYMDTKNQVHYLSNNLSSLRDVENITLHETGNKSKGTHATEEVNKQARRLAKHWLISSAYNEESPEILNLHKIRDPGLLREFIGWNNKGNYDRVSAFGMLMLLLEDYRKYGWDGKIEEEQSDPEPDFFNRGFGEQSYSNMLR